MDRKTISKDIVQLKQNRILEYYQIFYFLFKLQEYIEDIDNHYLANKIINNKMDE